MYSCVQIFVNNFVLSLNNNKLHIHYKGEIRTPVIDMTFKLGPSTTLITKIHRTELHVFKQ